MQTRQVETRNKHDKQTVWLRNAVEQIPALSQAPGAVYSPNNARQHSLSSRRPLFLTIHWWRPRKVNKTWFSHNPDSPRSSHSSNTTQNKELALSQPGNIHWIWASHALWLFFHRPHVGAFEAEAWEQLVAHYASNVNIISHTRFSDNHAQIILRITYWKGFG